MSLFFSNFYGTRKKQGEKKTRKSGEPFLGGVGHSCICRNWGISGNWTCHLILILLHLICHTCGAWLWGFIDYGTQGLGYHGVLKVWGLWLVILLLKSGRRWGQRDTRPWFCFKCVLKSSFGSMRVGMEVGYRSHGWQIAEREKRPVFSWRAKPQLQLLVLWNTMPSFTFSCMPFSILWNHIKPLRRLLHFIFDCWSGKMEEIWRNPDKKLCSA